MIAKLLRRIGFVLACLAMSAFVWMPAPWSPWWVLLLPVAAFVLLAVVLAGEFALLGAASGAAPGQQPAVSARVAAWWLELWVACRLVVWRMPVLGARHNQPSAARPQVQRGLVLVHGYGCNRGVWGAWMSQLERLQVPCVAVNLEPLFAPIADYGPIIETAVAEMQRRTGRAPVLVAHSMGGLAARIWWAQDPSARRLHRLITIGSPHQGTWMAKFGWGTNARQMRPQSAWLVALRAQEGVEHAKKTLCFYSDCDNLIMPSAAATLPGADNRQVTGAGHVAMVDHPDVFAAALDAAQVSD